MLCCCSTLLTACTCAACSSAICWQLMHGRAMAVQICEKARQAVAAYTVSDTFSCSSSRLPLLSITIFDLRIFSSRGICSRLVS